MRPNSVSVPPKYKEEPLFGRAQFRMQFKKWHHSNFGDYIEYEMIVQQLEGSRKAWVISKRYTDFVNLHEDLIPVFKI